MTPWRQPPEGRRRQRLRRLPKVHRLPAWRREAWKGKAVLDNRAFVAHTGTLPRACPHERPKAARNRTDLPLAAPRSVRVRCRTHYRGNEASPRARGEANPNAHRGAQRPNRREHRRHSELAAVCWLGEGPTFLETRQCVQFPTARDSR